MPQNGQRHLRKIPAVRMIRYLLPGKIHLVCNKVDLFLCKSIYKIPKYVYNILYKQERGESNVQFESLNKITITYS